MPGLLTRGCLRGGALSAATPQRVLRRDIGASFYRPGMNARAYYRSPRRVPVATCGGNDRKRPCLTPTIQPRICNHRREAHAFASAFGWHFDLLNGAKPGEVRKPIRRGASSGCLRQREEFPEFL